MKIHMLELLDGAKSARGTAVIIDVFRAFSLECYAYAQGVSDIIAAGAEEEARRLMRVHPDAFSVGERGGIRMPGFDCGNSPYLLGKHDLKGRLMIHTTSSGTQGIVNASGAEEILTGSLVNAGAIAEYLLRKDPEEVSIVAMGLSASSPAEEDQLCARYLKLLLENGGEPPQMDWPAEFSLLRRTQGQKFFRPETQADLPEQDFDLCIDVSRFDFVLRARREADGEIHIRRV